MLRRVLVLIGALAAATIAGWPAAAAAAPPSPASPTPSSSAPSGPGSSDAAGDPSKLTVVFDGDCDNWGLDVTNHDSVAHTVTLTVETADTAVIAPGQTHHFGFGATGAQPADPAVVTDSDGTVIDEEVLPPCTEVTTRSVTIDANTSYVLDTPVAPQAAAPAPQHGVVTPDAFHSRMIYRPDPCFAGTDSFGYSDGPGHERGTVTVTVRPGSCGVRVVRQASDCASRTVTYQAHNPYAVPARIKVAGPGDHLTQVVVPATSSKTWTAHVAAGDPAPVTFDLPAANRHLLTDDGALSCPRAVAGSGTGGGGGLAATGSSAAEPAAFGGAGLVVLGAGLLLAGCYRRRTEG